MFVPNAISAVWVAFKRLAAFTRQGSHSTHFTAFLRQGSQLSALGQFPEQGLHSQSMRFFAILSSVLSRVTNRMFVPDMISIVFYRFLCYFRILRADDNESAGFYDRSRT